MRNSIKGRRLLLFIFVISYIFYRCDFEKYNNNNSVETDDEPIARVFDRYLYLSDLKKILPKKINKNDSILFSDQYIDNWIKRELIIREMVSKPSYALDEIEKKTMDYRHTLMVYEFKKMYVEKKLKTTTTNEEVREYYEKNKNEFILDQDVIKCLFLKLNKEEKNITAIENALRKYPQVSLSHIEDWAESRSVEASLDTSTWSSFKEVTQSIPFSENTDADRFLKENSFVRVADNHFVYFVKVLDIKLKYSVGPLGYMEKRVIESILLKRKINLEKKAEEDIKINAKKKDYYEIY